METIDDIDELVSVSLNDVDEDSLIEEIEEHPLEWTLIFTESFVTLIIAFSVFYFILEVNEVSHYTDISAYNKVNNAIETVFLVISSIAIIAHLDRFRWKRNLFVKLEFDNYPMLWVMVICFLIDVGYYFMNFVSISTQCVNISRIFSTTAELLFVFSVLPFVIVCVCSDVVSKEIIMRIKVKVTQLLAMGGCVVIFMRKVSLKIEKDLLHGTKHNQTSVTSGIDFIHDRASMAEDVLELVDINLVLIVLLFLVDPLRRVSKLKTKFKQANFSSLTSRKSLVTSVSLSRFRWLTIVLSILLVALLVISSYVITDILDEDSIDKTFQGNSLLTYMLCTIVTYVVGIIYGTVYYFSDIQSWKLREDTYIVNDEHFNRFTSAFQIIYSGCMLLCLSFQSVENRLDLVAIQLIDFLALAIQVMVQAGCINAAIHRVIHRNEITDWRSKMFPPIALASINFGFMIISIVYSQNPIFLSYLQSFKANYLVYIVIKDVALPITILNRLHAMAFFINLSVKQWNEPLSVK